MVEPKDPVVELPTETKVKLEVEVVKSSGATAVYPVDVPKGTTLLAALGLLGEKRHDFM